MRSTKLPLSLLDERAKTSRVHILDTESFGTTFGPKAQRKRPNMKAFDVQVIDSSDIVLQVWQYITLMRRIYLVDCPGVVYPSGDSETDIILKGVVRIENVKDAAEHIPTVLERVKREYISKSYKISSWNDATDFLEQFARRAGKLLKGAEPDLNTVAKMMLNDFQRGKLPYFVPPPKQEGDETKPSKKQKTSQEPPVLPLSSSFVKASTENNNQTDSKAEENKSQEDVTTTVEDSESTSENKHDVNTQDEANNSDINAHTESASTGSSQFHVSQDFSAICVAPEFEGDDVKPLDVSKEDDKNKLNDDEEDDDDEEDVDEEDGDEDVEVDDNNEEDPEERGSNEGHEESINDNINDIDNQVDTNKETRKELRRSY
ncbi:hypothetical protein QZH41_003378 [Actinostola sp. cb2023]|nr:hypothetical protein QZH41_003378 [Actinostola sp. cb2023]